MKKILIVGGTGYIGGYLTDTLMDVYDVTVYDNLMYETRFFKNVKFIKGDIRDYDKLKTIIHDYDIICWLAAIVGDGACNVNTKLTYEVNEQSVEWISKNYKGKLIFMSTCSVYGINDDLIDEDAELNPLSDYARTKVNAEKYILANSNNYLIFRLGTLFGMSDLYSRPRLDLVVNVLTKFAVEGKTLNVFGGDQWRPLLHVKDVSNAIKYCIDTNINGLYNISSKNYTIAQIANEIKKIIPDAHINYKDVPFEDFRNYKVKTDKFNKLGWTPSYTLEDGIKEIQYIIYEKRIVEPDNEVYSNVHHLKLNKGKYD